MLLLVPKVQQGYIVWGLGSGGWRLAAGGRRLAARGSRLAARPASCSFGAADGSDRCIYHSQGG